MDPLANPYRPGAGTNPPALIGRDDLIDRFGISMRRTLADKPGKSLMPIGLRGVGKTVLVNRFVELSANEGFEVASIEAPERGDFALLLAAKLRRVLLSFQHGPVSRSANRALGVLKSFTLTLPGGASIRVEPEPFTGLADSGLLAEDVTDVLVAAGEAAQSRGQGILIATKRADPKIFTGQLIAKPARAIQLVISSTREGRNGICSAGGRVVCPNCDWPLSWTWRC